MTAIALGGAFSMDIEPLFERLQLSPSRVLREWACIESGPIRMFQPLPELIGSPPNMVLRATCFERVVTTRTYGSAREELIEEYVFGAGSSRPLVVATFTEILGATLQERPIYRLPAVALADECPSDVALLEARYVSKLLSMSLPALSNAATRGKIPGFERRGQRLFIPIGYVRSKILEKACNKRNQTA